MSSVIVLRTPDEHPWSHSTVERALSSFPASMTWEILSYRRWQDRQARILGRLLLQAGLHRLGFSPREALSAWRRDDFNRPFLAGCHVDFNISHTDGWTVCAVSTHGRVGVDVECVRPVSPHEFKSVFHQDEMSRILSSSDPSRMLIRCWSAKEAILKAEGKGLNNDLKEINCLEDYPFFAGVLWALLGLDMGKECFGFLATHTPCPRIHQDILAPGDLLARFATAWHRQDSVEG